MPKLNAACTDCGRRIPSADFEAGKVVSSVHTGARWCWDCTYKWIRKGR